MGISQTDDVKVIDLSNDKIYWTKDVVTLLTTLYLNSEVTMGEFLDSFSFEGIPYEELTSIKNVLAAAY